MRANTETAAEGAALAPLNATNRITLFVAQYLLESGTFAPSGRGESYADNVDYYKQRRSRQEIVADKIRYAGRWPTRVYTLVPGTLRVNPLVQPAGRFDVSFEYTFRVANATETKEGRGATRLVVEVVGADIRIWVEDGEVLQRH
jgi:hypothetical protein